MNRIVKLQQYLVIGYLLYSLIIIVLGLFVFGPFGGMVHAESEMRLRWNDYVEMYLGYLIPPAVYVIVFAFIPIRKLSKNKKISIGFFIPSIIIGFLMLFMVWSSKSLSHIDCANNCVASVPSYYAYDMLLLLLIPALIIVPSILAYVCFWSYRKK